MKTEQDIYICNACGAVFEVGNDDDKVSCPICNESRNIEGYSYCDLECKIPPDEVMVRLSRKIQIWFFTASSHIIRDLLDIEVDLVNHNSMIHNKTNSVITNAEYLLKLINNWKSASYMSGTKIVYFKGNPGCLITEENWTRITVDLMKVENDSKRLLAIMEECCLSEEETEINEETWENMEESVTEMLRSMIQIYRFFKNGVESNIQF